MRLRTILHVLSRNWYILSECHQDLLWSAGGWGYNPDGTRDVLQLGGDTGYRRLVRTSSTVAIPTTEMVPAYRISLSQRIRSRMFVDLPPRLLFGH